jgi:hypothetical protein
MKIVEGKEQTYKDWFDKNDDPYGRCCFEYAEAWANEMERVISTGAKLVDIADSTSHDVDLRSGFGITGFMYGCAVSILSECWIHGEELRKWHNGQYSKTEVTGAINPAILSVSV